MGFDILNCPHCLALLRRPPRLEAGTAVVCPRCRNCFAAPTRWTSDVPDAGPEPISFVSDSLRSPDGRIPQASRRVDDDEDIPEPPRLDGPTTSPYLRVACVLHGFAILGALAAVFVDVTSIVLGGPLISLVGIFVAVLGRRHSSRFGIAAGLSSVAFSLFIFLLISGLRWDPETATVPVRLMGSAYAAVSVFLLACTVRGSMAIESAKGGGTADRPD